MSMSMSMSMPNVPLYPPQQYPAQYAQQQSLTRVTRGLDSEDSEGGGGYDDNGNDNGNGRGSQVRVWACCTLYEWPAILSQKGIGYLNIRCNTVCRITSSIT